MATSKTKTNARLDAIRHHVAVELREIEALYDLNPRRAMGGSPDAPQLLFSGDWDSTVRAEWLDVEGELAAPLDARARVLLPMRGTSPFERTFERTRSQPIKERWVYVFETEDGDADAGVLLHELRFGKEGGFQYVDPATRQPVGERHAFLPLELGPGYRFYLTPFPLPAAALARLQTALQLRTVYLWDDFYLDANDGERPDPRRASPLFLRELDGKVPADGKLSFVLHLPCVLREGVRRAEEYSAAVARLEGYYESIDEQGRYGLARRIDLFTQGKDSRKIVEQELERTLSEGREKERRLTRAAEELCDALLEWCGTLEGLDPLRDPATGESILAYEGNGRDPTRWRPAGQAGSPGTARLYQPPVSAFTLAVNDCETADEAVVDDVAMIVARVHLDLSALPQGNEWLGATFREVVVSREPTIGAASPTAGPLHEPTQTDGVPPREDWSVKACDAGAALLLRGKPIKKRLSQGTGWVLKAYSRFWADAYQETALGTFRSFVKTRLGITTEEGFTELPKEQRTKILSEASNYTKAKATLQRKKALEETIEASRKSKDPSAALHRRDAEAELERLPRMELDPDFIRKFKKAQNVLSVLECAIGWADAWIKLREMAKEETRKDPKKWLNLASSVVSSIQSTRAVSKIQWKAPLFKVHVSTGFSKLGLAGELLALFTEVIALAECRDRGERTGHWLSFTGAAVGLVAGLILGGPPAVVAAALAAIVSAVGGFISEHLSDSAEFLRACAFANARFDTEAFQRRLSAGLARRPPVWLLDPVQAPAESIRMAKVTYEAVGAATRAGKVEAVVAEVEARGSPTIDRYWHHGDRERFRRDYAAQHDALDQIVHDYEPHLALDVDVRQVFVAVDVWEPTMAGDDTALWSLSGKITVARWSPTQADGAGAWSPSIMREEQVARPRVRLIRADGQLGIGYTRTYLIPLAAVPSGPERTDDLINIAFDGTVTAVVQMVRVQAVHPVTLSRPLKASISIEPYRTRTYGPTTPQHVRDPLTAR